MRDSPVYEQVSVPVLGSHFFNISLKNPCKLYLYFITHHNYKESGVDEIKQRFQDHYGR